MSKLVESSTWQALTEHAEEMRGANLRGMFTSDPERVRRYSAEAAGIHLDYSKNLANDKTLSLLMSLAREQQVEAWRDQMFSGEKINASEDRAVLHTALRQQHDAPVRVGDEDVIPAVREVQQRMRRLVDGVRSGEIRGHTGKRIEHVVNIGIGGSDLGPLMTCSALHPYADPSQLRVHFVSNIDLYHLSGLLEVVDPETTLFIIASKSFTTAETMHNAHAARAWFVAHTHENADVSKHFVAVSAKPDLAEEFGIARDNVFEFWDWVGGRYSLWSAIGLSIAMYLGMDNFEAMLAGAAEMDEHFKTAPLEENLPVLMGMLGVWYNNFFGARQYLILPYNYALRHLHSYVQQLDMESNGKGVDRDGNFVDYATGPTVWGGAGCNAQHSFYQLAHQGTHLLPSDLIIAGEPIGERCFQPLLAANYVAQSEALLRGKLSNQEGDMLPANRQLLGNRPSNAIVLECLSPHGLGALIALYEHKVFVQGMVWNINPYDQWGVELGKQLAEHIFEELYSAYPPQGHDKSTDGLIERLRGTRHDQGRATGTG